MKNGSVKPVFGVICSMHYVSFRSITLYVVIDKSALSQLNMTVSSGFKESAAYFPSLLGIMKECLASWLSIC
jgi:hypothetical protein